MFCAVAWDCDGTIEKFLWDFNGDDQWDRVTPPAPYSQKMWCCNFNVPAFEGQEKFTFYSPGTYAVTCRAIDDKGAWVEECFTIKVKAVEPNLVVSVTPNPVPIEPGGYHLVTYTFRETNGCEVKLPKRTGQFLTPSGEPLTEEFGPMSQDITVPAKGSTTWIDNIYLPPEVASEAQKRGLDRVIHRARFYGKDCAGKDVKVTVDLEIVIKQPACPDLAMEDLWVVPTSFTPGQEVTVYFKGANIGTGNAGAFRVGLLLDGRLVGSAVVEGMDAGKELTGYANLSWPDSNCHTIKVVLDMDNKVSVRM